MDQAARILIVGCGFPQLGLVRAAKGLGLFVIGVDGNPGAIGASYCDRFVPCSTHDVEAIAAVFRAEGAHGIVTCGSELALTTTSRAAAMLGVPFYADSQTVERCQSKDLMRAAYQAGGAPSPAFVQASTFEEAEAF